MPTTYLDLHELHPGQQFVRDNRTRFCVLCCGRRWGKTDYMLDDIITEPKGALDGEPVAWFAPTYKMLQEPWRNALRMLQPVIKKGGVSKSERRIELKTGGSVTFWTMKNADDVRGREYGRVAVDEAAKQRGMRETFIKVIRPLLAVHRGWATIGSSPISRTGFQELFEMAREPERAGRWSAFQMPTSTNPFIDPDEIEDARLDSHPLEFLQEWLAQFVDFGGTSIRREWLQWDEPTRWPESDLYTVVGVDLAIGQKTINDWTAIVVLSQAPDGIIYIRHAERRRLPFHEILNFIGRTADPATQPWRFENDFDTGIALPPKEGWPVQAVKIEDVAFQASVVQEMIRTTTLPIQSYNPGTKDKVARFGPVATRFARGLFRIGGTVPNEFVNELLAFPQQPSSGAKGEQSHDDFVDALTAAFNGLRRKDAVRYATGGRRTF